MSATHHYPALDGLRGIAALSVVFFHLGGRQFSHGFLAVDFFFALSGFVVAHAYEAKLRDNMSFGDFIRVRLIRLYPLMLLGTVIGAIVCKVESVDLPVMAYVAQLTWIPFAAGSNTLFPINNVQWSLTLEAAANIAHALILRKLPEWALALLVAAGFVGLVISAWRFGTLSLGWGHANWMGGVARLVFSYPLGVLAFRLQQRGRLPHIELPFAVLALALLATMIAVSYAGSAYADLLVVVVVFPLILLAGLGVADSAIMRRPIALLGTASFPLYAIHYPLAWRVWPHVPPTFHGSLYLAAVVLFILALAADWAFDRPVRAFLMRVTQRPAAPVSASA